MKRATLLLLLLSICPSFIAAEITLGGEGVVTLSTLPLYPHTAERFDGSLNPDNLLDLHDLDLEMTATLKFSLQGANDGLLVWMAVHPYDLAAALFAAATGSVDQTAAVGEALSLSGAPLYGFRILRAYAEWVPAPALLFRLGRQSLRTGYGYGWNPIDFASQVKVPFDPDRELEGSDAITLRSLLGSAVSVKMGAVFHSGSLNTGVDVEDLQAVAELKVSVPSFEITCTGFFDHDGSGGEDGYVPAAGLGFMADLWGLGLYGEAAVLKGSRTPIPIGGGVLEFDTDWRLSGLGGMEYTFAGGLGARIEYFYNGEGYSLTNRKSYRQELDSFNASVGAPPAQFLLLYRPGFFARHYLLLNLLLPLSALNTDSTLTVIYSPDSGAMHLLPALSFNLSGSLAVELGYVGLFSLRPGQDDEASLAPAPHILNLTARYSF